MNSPNYIGGVNLKDREQFMKNWEVQRRKGKLKYVITHAGSVGIFGLVGVVIGSVFFYNSPRTYSFAYYLPTYFQVFLGVSLIATMKFMYEWGKNEEKYSNLLDK